MESSREPRDVLDAAEVLRRCSTSLYRKTALTAISDITFPPGTTYQTPEGLRAEDEDTRAAFDVQGGVYPIRESVFRDSYALSGSPSSPDRLREAVIEYLAADADMPEFADAQRMEAEEWDRRNRRWAAADVALKAALDSSTGDRPEPPLDVAWAEAEAALPEGWVLWGVRFRSPAPSRKRGQYEAWAGPVGLVDAPPWPRPSRGSSGYSADSPAAALIALAARLRATPQPEPTEPGT